MLSSIWESRDFAHCLSLSSSSGITPVRRVSTRAFRLGCVLYRTHIPILRKNCHGIPIPAFSSKIEFIHGSPLRNQGNSLLPEDFRTISRKLNLFLLIYSSSSSLASQDPPSRISCRNCSDHRAMSLEGSRETGGPTSGSGTSMPCERKKDRSSASCICCIAVCLFF